MLFSLLLDVAYEILVKKIRGPAMSAKDRTNGMTALVLKCTLKTKENAR